MKKIIGYLMIVAIIAPLLIAVMIADPFGFLMVVLGTIVLFGYIWISKGLITGEWSL